MKMVQKKRIEQYLARGHDIWTTSQRGGTARSVRHDREPNISRPVNKKFILWPLSVENFENFGLN